MHFVYCSNVHRLNEMHVYNLHKALTEQPTAQIGFLDNQLHHLTPYHNNNVITNHKLVCKKIMGVAWDFKRYT